MEDEKKRESKKRKNQRDDIFVLMDVPSASRGEGIECARCSAFSFSQFGVVRVDMM